MLKLLCMCKLVLFMVTLSYIGYWKIIIFTGASEDSLKSGEQLQYINGSLFKPQLCSTTLNYCLFFESIGDQVYLVVFDNNTKTVAWIANRDDPIANFTSNAALTLDFSGVLQITRDSGKPISFYPLPSLAHPVFIMSNKTFTATLSDSGNFVLQQHDYIDGSKSMLWQSFNLPTDVLLPGMKLGCDPKCGRMWSIVSYSHPNVPGSGPFSLEWNHYEKQLNILRNGKVYWESGELINNYTFEHIPENMYEYLIDEESITFKARKDKHYAPWKLTSEGVLLDSAENVLAKANECRGYNDDNGCQNWDVPITCRNQTFEFDVINATVKNAGNLNGSADLRVNFSTSDCEDACWRNCDCVGFTSLFDNGTGCYFVYKALDNIQPGSDIFYGLNIKTDSSHPKTPSSDSKGNTKQHSRWKLIFSLIIAISILCGCGCLLCIVRKRKKFALKVKEKEITTEHTIHHLNSYGFDYPNDSRGSIKHERDLRLFSYASVVEATNGFSSLNELGKGGFGPVYKGILMGKEVAIKRLSRTSRQGVVEFKNEIMLESKLQHINLVQLLGCCIHEDERLLIYEYMPNKSLDFSLFDSTQRKLLDWKKRVNIIQGIAQGLLYLHKYSRLRIVHRDLKASNILLDKYMNPKISDFGMARIFMQESQEKTTRIVGTIGYMPPEYIIKGVFSKMSDVYSFGVLILEIVSGRRNNSFDNASNPINIVGHAWELWKEDQALKLLDPTLHDLVVQDEALRYIHVALLCVEECPDDRPTMLEVSSMLSNANEKLPLHKRPAFYFRNENHPKIDSINDMSISDLSAR